MGRASTAAAAVLVVGVLTLIGCAETASDEPGADRSREGAMLSKDRVSAEIPAGWSEIEEPISSIVDPAPLLAVASEPLEVDAPPRGCGPSAALLDQIRPSGALVEVLEASPPRRGPSPWRDFPSRPARIELDRDTYDTYECAGSSHQIVFRENGRGVYVHVWFDPERVDPKIRRQAVAFVNSLELRDVRGEQSSVPHSRWDRLALPPEVRNGGSFLAADDQILLFGGCAVRPRHDCRRTRDGFAYTPATDDWTRMPKAPFGAIGASVWTGEEAIFLNTGSIYKQPGTVRSVRGVAFDPDHESWRGLPRAPLRIKGSEALWTGAEVIVWGGGGRWSPAAGNGVAYDPASDEWRKIARAPISLDNVSLTWTGTEMIAFGSRLDFRNRASTRVAIGAAYDPATDRWRRIADSKLSPQADTTARADGRVLAYDYSPEYQLYDPARDAWSPKRPMPLRFAECYPDSVAIPDGVIASFCGQVAVYDSATRRWSKVTGGITRRKLRGYQDVNFWGQASIGALGHTAYFLATGYGRRPNGEFPRSFWSYSPAP